MSNKSRIIYSDDMGDTYYLLKEISDSMHADIVNGFSNSNILYNISSVIEDVVLDDYLSMYNTAKSISISNVIKNNLVIESFTSDQYYDLDYPVDEKLNLDVQNGDLTLPIKSTKTLEVSGVVLGTESNGSAGNSEYNNRNSNINNIISSTGLFEYEKISSSWVSDKLTLSATLILKNEEYANGVYLKMYVEGGTRYPEIESIEISQDGEEWVDATNNIDVNKADHYIRFNAKKIKFVKIILSQEDGYSINDIDSKRRYLIGIREFSVKQTYYKPRGEYISKPFSSNTTIRSVVFNSNEKANSDIKYLISADNGTKWVQLSSGEQTDLNNSLMGLSGDIDINAIRIKVLLDRSLLPNSSLAREWLTVNNSEKKYFLENNPTANSNISAWVGGHISCGDDVAYELNLAEVSDVDPQLLSDPKCVIDKAAQVAITLKYVPYYASMRDDVIVKVNGMTLKDDVNTYSFLKHTNKLHSILVLNKDAFLSGSIPSSQISIQFAPFRHDSSKEKTEIISLPESRPAFVPSKDGISITTVKYQNIEAPTPSHLNIFDNVAETYSEIEGKQDVDGVNCWLVSTGDIGTAVCPKQYSITPYNHSTGGYSYSPSKWRLEGSNDGTSWVLIHTGDISTESWDSGNKQTFKLSNDCYFQYFRFRVTENSSDSNATTLVIANINLYEGEDSILDNNSFEVLDRTTIVLSKESYSIDWDYLVEYIPCVSIDKYLPETIEKNKVVISGMPDAPVNSKICLEYKYQDSKKKDGEMFYTPICNEYRMEIL